MDSILEFLAKRLSEPSTYVSLGVLTTAIGWNIAPEKWQAIATICMGLGGLIGTIIGEKKKTTSGEIKNVVEAVVRTDAVKTVTPSPAALDVAMKKPVVP